MYIASKNKDKVNAVKALFPNSTIHSISVPSDVDGTTHE
jgi:non-canonical (house-cleaning) NTP pyrophosphatase